MTSDDKTITSLVCPVPLDSKGIGQQSSFSGMSYCEARTVVTACRHRRLTSARAVLRGAAAHADRCGRPGHAAVADPAWRRRHPQVHPARADGAEPPGCRHPVASRDRGRPCPRMRPVGTDMAHSRLPVAERSQGSRQATADSAVMRCSQTSIFAVGHTPRSRPRRCRTRPSSHT